MVQQQERLIAACFLGLPAPAAQAQAPSGEVLKIGYGIAQTGGPAPNGKSALSPTRSGRKISMPRAGCSAAPSNSSTTMIRVIRRHSPASTRGGSTSSAVNDVHREYAHS